MSLRDEIGKFKKGDLVLLTGMEDKIHVTGFVYDYSMGTITLSLESPYNDDTFSKVIHFFKNGIDNVRCRTYDLNIFRDVELLRERKEA